MPLASTNCVGAVWWECIIILAPLLFIRSRIRYEREGRFRAINVILHRGCAAETDRSDNFSIHLEGKSAAPRRHILIHHRLVSLVLGLKQPCLFPLGRRYPSGFAVVVTRSKRESHVQRRAPGTCGARRDWSRGRRSAAHSGY